MRAALAALIGCLLLAQCRTKPTEEECAEGFLNYVRLQTEGDKNHAAMMDEARIAAKDLAKVCVAKKSRKRVLCEINAKRLPDLSDCTAF